MRTVFISRHSNARPHLSGAFHVRRPSLGTIFLALVPFFAMCFSVSAWDRIYPMVFGLPFNIFWLLSGIVLTSICIGAMYRLEASRTSKYSARRQRESRPE
jgi:membrane protein required for beta-lactamase induction